ncbi:MAG TPA: RluA family pseudouridine synthase [Candidatus Saccharimonadales bacterium]|nr:RluA family pseudouridine synthase [Candidatus Saccharimonadales bacterium]
MQVLKVSVKPKLDRLDQFVSSQIKVLSRSKANKLIKEGFIRVNEASLEPSYKVRKGDKIVVEIPVEKEVSLKAENIPLDFVYEDKDLLVIDKPAGLVTHPTLDHPSGTVVNALLSHLGSFDQESNRPGIVHRLDKNTSGLLVVAKNQDSLEALKEQFKKRVVEKKYLALVGGRVEKEKGEIKGSIQRHPKFKQKFIVGESGKEAVTDYKVVERFSNFTLVELTPKTGRTHQIRVHLSHLGHPIVGDKLYGGKMLLSRQFLHAGELAFVQPTSKKKLKFTSNLPDELKKVLAKL